VHSVSLRMNSLVLEQWVTIIKSFPALWREACVFLVTYPVFEQIIVAAVFQAPLNFWRWFIIRVIRLKRIKMVSSARIMAYTWAFMSVIQKYDVEILILELAQVCNDFQINFGVILAIRLVELKCLTWAHIMRLNYNLQKFVNISLSSSLNYVVLNSVIHVMSRRELNLLFSLRLTVGLS
jgi:hypothetical protein